MTHHGEKSLDLHDVVARYRITLRTVASLASYIYGLLAPILFTKAAFEWSQDWDQKRYRMSQQSLELKGR